MPELQTSESKTQRHVGLAQDMEILEWKWDMNIMDFITGLPRFRSQNDSIWMILDRMTKIHPLLARKNHSFGRGLCEIIHSGGCENSWSPSVDNFR